MTSTTDPQAHPESPSALARLAEALGVAPEYTDVTGVRRTVSDASLFAALAALDVELPTPDGAADPEFEAAVERASEQVRLRPWRRVLPPTVVATEGRSRRVEVRVPDGASLEVLVELEAAGPEAAGSQTAGSQTAGSQTAGSQTDGREVRLRQLPVWVDPVTVDGVRTGCATVELPATLPAGWHRLVAVVDGLDPRAGTGLDSRDGAAPSRDSGTATVPGSAVATLVVGPSELPLPAGLDRRRAVGVATQLYQLRSARSWGLGDLADLADLADLSARELGFDFVLVNPMHAAEPVPPIEPSPYLPISRRFVSPLYVRVEDVPEYAYLEDLDRLRVDRLAAESRGADLIDRDRSWSAKSAALRILFAHRLGGRHAAAFAAFRAEGGPALEEFATWCALAEEYGTRWHSWPAGLRRPDTPEVRAFAEERSGDITFHAWLQFVTTAQRADAQRSALAAGMRVGIVHDLAVGVHPEGADTWALPDSLARGVTVGAPPDVYNQKGQNWSQPPLRPDVLAETGYAAFRDLVRAALRDAGGVRIDHILGLYRLWWIPEGASPTEGAYVHYDLEAMLAILALEAQRAGAVVVGEDLGTVPEGLRDTLASAGLLGTSVLWFERDSKEPLPPAQYRRLCMTSVTTHDLPPTAGYLDLEHVRVREELGQLTTDVDEERRSATEEIVSTLAAVESAGYLPPTSEHRHAVDDELVALHRFAADAPSVLQVVSLADLLGDRRAVNMPGTSDEYPNWRVPLSDGQGRPAGLEELSVSEMAHRIARAFRRE